MKKHVTNLWGREPTMILGLVQAGITLGVTFGLHLSVEQVGAILTFTTAVLTFITRQASSSPVQVAQKIEEAKKITEPVA
jgi:hypothetical protein